MMLTKTNTAFKCPHCGVAIETDSPSEDTVVACPNERCQKSFKVSVPVAEPVDVDPIFELRDGNDNLVSPLPQPVLSLNKDDPVRMIRLEMLRRHPVAIALYAATMFAAVVGASMAWSNGQRFLTMMAVALFGLAAWRLGMAWYRTTKSWVEITPKRTILRQEFLNGQDIEVMHDEIVEIEIERNAISRLLNVGDLILVGSNEGKVKQLILRGILNPDQIAEDLGRLRA